MKSKKICVGIIILLSIFIVGCQIFKMIKNNDNDYKSEDSLIIANEENQNEIEETEVVNDENAEELIGENVEINAEEQKEETNINESVKETTVNNENVKANSNNATKNNNSTAQKITASTQNKKEIVQQETLPVQEKPVSTTPAVTQPAQTQPTPTPQVENIKPNQTDSYDITKEKDVRNDDMINKIKNVINSNPSSNMLQYGYTIVVDSSIKELTNQFTFTENRVKNMIRYSLGTIKIYAEDHYYDGQFRMTACYIL